MEYSLRPDLVGDNKLICFVLILILMEYSLRHSIDLSKAQLLTRLNPYSNGI